MATESAADTELSVTLSSPLSEWLDERAAALGVDRETLLVQLLGTYREAADMDDELTVLLSDVGAFGDRDTIEELDDRIDEVDASLSENVEDLRGRILQLKDAVHSRAPAEHDHPQIGTVLDRVEDLAADVESAETDLDEAVSELEALTVKLGSADDRLGTVETKLDHLARAVLELKRQSDGTADSAEALAHLRRVANRHETTAADCGDCGERLQIGLLTEASCPHCGYEFREIEYPSSLLRRFKTPTLTGSDPVSTEADDA